MRYAIFSDVHSNLEAFRTVLEFFEKSHVDRYVFIGDIVGYGANPGECIALLKNLKSLSIVGNHDWAVVGQMEPVYFNEAARDAVLWTKEKISESDKAFISEMKLVEEEKTFCLAHGTLSAPENFEYMTDSYQAASTFSVLGKKICFVGHSHQPGVFIESAGAIVFREPEKLLLEKDKRYIINDGSVGQPRDGDPRACCCIYDDTKNTIEFKRLEYDIKSAAAKIIEADLPRFLAERLAQGR